MRNTLAFVLGGGRGTRLQPLTKYRAKPAVPLAGKYRLIDIPLSNCINSGLNRIYVLTQFLSVSLHRHIRQTYRFDPFSGGFVELLAAQQTAEAGTDWYEGTADAVRKNIRYVDQPGVENVLILSGDQLYRMDFQEMYKTHVESNADVTIAAIPVSRDSASQLGIMRINEDGRVVGFLEKPKTDEELKLVRMEPSWLDSHGIESKGRDCLASMGIYLFKRKTLEKVLRQTTYWDFGKEIFPAAIRTHRVQVHLFDGYWEDIGTIGAFYEANLALASPNPPFDLAQPEAPIYSRARFLPPSQLQKAQVENSIIADGCRIGSGAVIINSVIGHRCIIGSNVTIRNSILMGADEYQTSQELASANTAGHPQIGIGSGSTIDGAIIDKNCQIGNNVKVIACGGPDRDIREVCSIRDGIPVIVKDATLPDGWSMDE
ncbi:MAG: glucose-1-phosphate adenylyltransferase [Pirellulaceae bacterium]|nr:glucose-1-phosphate adenylyltransferase [Planctomycetales bacterium]